MRLRENRKPMGLFCDYPAPCCSICDACEPGAESSSIHFTVSLILSASKLNRNGCAKDNYLIVNL